jgi:hypothetical protein
MPKIFFGHIKLQRVDENRIQFTFETKKTPFRIQFLQGVFDIWQYYGPNYNNAEYKKETVTTSDIAVFNIHLPQLG